MLRYLEIRNIALIDRASIEFGPGLCVLTGETGAGKSIIIDSINAALGAKLDRDAVRADSGPEGGGVTAVFSLDDGEPGDDNAQLAAILAENGLSGGTDLADGAVRELILAREISVSGRNICRVNGKLVASSVLRAIGEQIVDLHGQHDNHSLMRREKHIDLIDNFGGPELLAARDAYSAAYTRYWRLRRQLEQTVKNEAERARRVDILTHQLNEIKAVRPRPKEDERLEAEIGVLANAEKIQNTLYAAYASLGGGDGGSDSVSAVSAIQGALQALSQISRFSPKYAEIEARVSEAQYALEDALAWLRLERDGLGYDQNRLDKLNARLEEIERLKRKYGATIGDIHVFYRDAARTLAELSDSERAARDLTAELEGAVLELDGAARKLSELRRRAADVVEGGAVRELSALEMKNARFEVAMSAADDPAAFNAKGRDQVEFLFSANAGEDVKPLARIASGGEMSRVMLAIKSILSGADNIPTMIFDEIDAGISGNAASRVAEKMYRLSRGRQIVCVTHLAQIACMADDQLLIEKSTVDDETRTSVEKLEYGRRVNEISRMLGGGEPTEASVRLSGELLERAADFKSSVARQDA